MAQTQTSLLDRMRRPVRAAGRRWSAWSVRKRRATWGILLAGAAIALATHSPWTAALRVWEFANALFAARVGLGALPNLPTLARVRGVLVRWSAILSVVLTLLLFATVERVTVRLADFPAPTGLLFFFWLPVAVPLTFAFAFSLSAAGALFGVHVAGRAADRAGAARVGAVGIWLTLLGVVLAATLFGAARLSDGWTEWLLTGFPIFCLWLAPVARRLESEPATPWVLRTLQRRCVWSLSWRDRRRTLDGRPAACAAAGFGLAAALTGAGLLAGFQASSQVWLIDQRRALSRLNFTWEGSTTARRAERPILLTWDPKAVRLACTDSSESAVQARVVGRLAAWGARWVVVPPPALDASSSSNQPPQPPSPVGARQAGDNVRDLPRLEDALRAATNAILALPEEAFQTADHGGSEDAVASRGEATRGEEARDDPAEASASETASPLQRLRLSARRVGLDSFGSFHAGWLPTIQLHPRSDGLLPACLMAAAGPEPRIALEGSRRAKVGDTALVCIEEGSVLVDFTRPGRGQTFLEMPISALLEGDSVYGETAAGGYGWMDPAAMARGKILVMEALLPRHRETPAGEISHSEAAAYACATLLGNSGASQAPGWALGAWSLACALLVSAGRSDSGVPARGLRLAMLLGCIFLATVAGSFGGLWIDPVLPTVSAAAAFGFHLQLSLALERQAKDRNRSMLQRFVATEVVESLLEDPEARLSLGGHRERLGILFADIRGFSRFAEDHSPEEVVQAVNARLRAMTDALHHHGGLLDKYTGDGLMALFRLKNLGPEGPVRAARAALAMRDAACAVARAVASDDPSGGDTALQVGIGLHVGEAILGLVGNETHQVGFTALGHAVVVAARLQTLAAGGEVIVSDDLREAIDRVNVTEFVFEPLEPASLKGLSTPVRCHRLLAAPPRFET